MAKYIVLAMLLLVAPSWAQLKFESQKSEDTFRLEGSTLVISSSMGIGRVTVTPEGKWPAIEHVRFEYASGQGMTRLENLKVTWGESYLKNTFKEKASAFFVDSETITTSQLRRLKLKLVDEAVTLVLPPGLFSEVESVEIHWVDAYR